MTPIVAPAWAPDTALAGFETRTIALPPDYDGPVVATLVRRRANAPTGRAVLYLHGFIDYFFQAHMADAYNAGGFHFYALDLRKHGRSLLPHQRPNFCKDLREYDPEIDAAIEIISGEEGCEWLLLNGHSTGGLTAALYADAGARRDRLDALFLNSPFFGFNRPPLLRSAVPAVAALGRLLPDLTVDTLNPLYCQSVHKSHRGEWEFDLKWKPVAGFPIRAGWLRAVHLGQRRLAAGLKISCPVLVMHSARSIRVRAWHDDMSAADAVLNVEDMRRLAPRLGREVSVVSVEGGMHDLALSPAPARERMFGELFAWVQRVAR